MNNKINFLLTLLLICSSVLFSQTKEEAFRDAKTTSKATLEKDFETVLRHTYSPVLELMGGKENAIKTIEDMFVNMEAQGFVFEKADPVFVSDVVYEQNDYRCYIYGNNQMKMNNMRIYSKSYLLGIYNKDKKLWEFIEASKMKNKALMDQIYPDFKTALKIPDDETRTEQIDD